MAEPKKVIRSALLPLLQLSLGLFLIMKTTPLWAVIHCSIAYFLDCCHFPYTDYKQLREFEGRVFKQVISHATTAGEVSKVKKQGDVNAESHIGRPISVTKRRDPENSKEKGKSEKISVEYLGQKFTVERKDENMMLVNDDGPAYRITDEMWETVKYIKRVAQETVFVKNQKEIWEEVVTGDIMQFEEVLDSVILDNRAVVRLDQDYFLPVNLLLAEDKLRATLNFVGIFLQTQKQVHWVISASLSLTAVLMGFSTTVRLSVIGKIDKVICRGAQFVCDLLPFAMRRFIYSWTSWVPGLKPSNDIQARIIKGDVEVLVAGGAKFHSLSELEPIIFDDCSVKEVCLQGGPVSIRCDPNCGSNCDSKYDKVYIEWMFHNEKCSLKRGRVALNSCGNSPLKEIETCIVCGEGDGKTRKDIRFKSDDSHSVQLEKESCEGEKKSIMAKGIHTASVDIDCSEEESRELLKVACSMAEVKSGSLKSYDTKSHNVFVRRFVESINAYVRSGYPPLHKLQLRNVVVR